MALNPSNSTLRRTGWAADLTNALFNLNGSINENVRNQVRNNFAKGSSERTLLDSMSDSELDSYLSEYWTKGSNFYDTDLFGSNEYLDFKNLYKDLSEGADANITLPEVPNYTNVYNEGYQNSLNNTDALLSSLKEDYAGLENDRNRELSDSRLAYGNSASQLMSNQYQQNNQLLGSMRSELNRNQRSALESGASAGIRIAENINTLMSTQNKQAQASLETSNNLAAMLLNQQNALSGIRQGYASQLASNKSSQRDYSYNRTGQAMSEGSAKANAAQNNYNNNLQTAEDSFAALYQNNPFADRKKSNLYKTQYSSSGYGTGTQY